MTHPAWAARLWLVSLGRVAKDVIVGSTVLDVTALVGPQRRQRRATRLRLVSVFQRGWTPSWWRCSGTSHSPWAG